MPVSNDPARPRAPSLPSGTSSSTPATSTPPATTRPVPGTTPPIKVELPPKPPSAETPDLPELPPDLFNAGDVPITPRARVVVAGDAPSLLKPIEILVPDLPRIPNLDKLIERFGKDFAVLAEQIIHAPGQTREQKAQRLMEFFLAYAERFVEIVHFERPGAQGGNAQDGQGKNLFKGDPELAKALKAMLESMRDAGYEGLRDAHTGKNAILAARELLTSTPPEFKEKAAAAQWVPGQTAPSDKPTQNPERYLPERQAERAAQAANLEVRRPDDKALPDKLKVAAWSAEAARMPVVMPKPEADGRMGSEENPWERAASTQKRLGANMLWNVLHRFRGTGEDMAVNQAKWDRLAIGAILLLGGIALVAVVLITL